jgi:8-amino-7-oxononanoate synthase
MTSRSAADGIRASGLPYVFSTANAPAAVAAALAALRILRDETVLRQHLRDNAEVLRPALTVAGAPPMPGTGAVVAVTTGSGEDTAAAWRLAHDAGVYVNAVLSRGPAVPRSRGPAVPRGQGLLRMTVIATHTDEQLRQAGEVVGAAVLTVRQAAQDEAATAVP